MNNQTNAAHAAFPPQPSAAPMLVAVPDLDGWTEIATYLRVSEDSAQEWAKLPVDPLPILKHRLTRKVSAHRSALDAWLSRMVLPAQVCDEIHRLQRAVRRGAERIAGAKQRKRGRKKS